jgi:hypothetical protein
MSPILGIWASSKVSATPDTGAMFPLQVITVGAAGASNLTFTNIPNTYTHLQIRAIGRGTVAQGEMQIFVRFNSDTGNNYSSHLLRGDGSAVATASSTSNSKIDGVTRMSAANATSGIFGVSVIDVLDYANTNKYKTLRALGGVDANGSGQVYYKSGLWMSTSAITSVTIGIDDGGNFAQYSQFALYGIKGAA